MKIPDIPLNKAAKVAAYAENSDNWINVSVNTKIAKKIASRHLMELGTVGVQYYIAYRNNEDDEAAEEHGHEGIGELPYRCLSFKIGQEYTKEEAEDFINRTLELFKFNSYQKVNGKSGVVHFHEQMFK